MESLRKEYDPFVVADDVSFHMRPSADNGGDRSPAISVENLSVHYGNFKAVDDVSFEVPKGEVFGFVGPNGAGKTTIIKVLTTLLSPTAGRVTVLGHDIVSSGMDVRRRIAVVQQKLVFEPFLTVERALNLYGILWNIPNDKRKKKVDEVLESFDLIDKRKSPLTELSIGLQRRVQVAQEFLHDPELIFLDEPTIGLDPLARRRTLDLIKARVGEGLTVFYTTHVLEEVEYLCDMVAVLVKGKIVALDTPGNLKRKYGYRKTLEIHLADSLADRVQEFADALAHYGDGYKPNADVKVESDSGLITLVTERPDDIFQEITSLASSYGIGIKSLITKEPSLEESFIEILRSNGT